MGKTVVNKSNANNKKVSVKKKTTQKKKHWSFCENVICCYVYKEFFVINGSSNVKNAIDKVNKIFKKRPKPVNSIDQKFKNIKMLMNSSGRSDTFPRAARANFSKANKAAFDIVM